MMPCTGLNQGLKTVILHIEVVVEFSYRSKERHEKWHEKFKQRERGVMMKVSRKRMWMVESEGEKHGGRCGRGLCRSDPMDIISRIVFLKIELIVLRFHHVICYYSDWAFCSASVGCQFLGDRSRRCCGG